MVSFLPTPPPRFKPKQILQRWRQRHQSGWRPRNLLVYLLFGGLAVGVTCTAWVSYRLVRELLLDNLTQNAVTSLNEGAQEIDDWLVLKQETVRTLAQSPTVQSLDWDAIRPYLTREVERLDAFVTLALVNPNGDFRNYLDQTGNISDRAYIQAAFDGDPSISDPVVARALKEKIIAMAAPIRPEGSPDDAPPVAVLTGGISFQRFASVLSRLSYGEGSYSFALNRDRELISEVHATQQTSRNADLEAEAREQLAPLLRDLIDRSDDIQRVDLNGDRVYLAYQPLDTVDWTIALVIPDENIEKQLRTLDLLAGVLGVILAAATVLAGRQLAHTERSRARAARETLLNKLTSRLHTSPDLDNTLPPTLQDLAYLLSFDCVTFAWYDRASQSLDIAHEYCQDPGDTWTTRLRAADPDSDLDTQLRLGASTRLIAEPSGNTVELNPDRYSAFPIQNRLGTPGYLLCRHSLPVALNAEETDLIQRVVAQLSIALTQAHLYGEMQRAIDSLKREQQQLRQIVTNAPVAMAMFDSDLNYLAFSSKWLTDYDLDGDRLLDLDPDEIQAHLPAPLHDIYPKALAGEIVVDPELTWTRDDGNALYFRAAIHPWYVPEGDIGGIIVVTECIDDLVKARLEAERAAQFKSDFLANMSHEIRTPMNGVLGMTNLLARTQLKRQQREYVGAISRSAQHLLTLINDILDFSKLEAGEMEFEAIDFDLDRCVEDVIDLVATQVEEKGNIELVTLIDPGVPRHLRGDPARLRQVLLNLVGNAIKFTNRGEVAIQAALESETSDSAVVRFAVRDTGIGISKAGQEKLFQSFSQVDASTTRQYGGTGLGLAISQQIVQLMDGEIGVESVEGIGSIFWFTVRLELADSLPSSALPAMPMNMSRLRLLVAANNATTRQSVRYLMQSWGIENITEVGSGQEAIEYLKTAAERSRPYDILILDLQLSDIARDDFLSELRRDRHLRDTKVVVMSNFKNRATAEAFLKRGAASYFLKPVRASRLFDALIAAVAPQLDLDRHGDDDFFDPALPLPSKRFSNLKLLVVEDHPTNQQVILSQLEELGVVCPDCAANGREALDRLAEKPYDIVLMDCQMPVLDGYAAARAVREREGSDRHTVIIALTAHAMPADRDKCIAAGMDDYIPKPVDWDVLHSTLDRWVDARGEAAPLPDSALAEDNHSDDPQTDDTPPTAPNAAEPAMPPVLTVSGTAIAPTPDAADSAGDRTLNSRHSGRSSPVAAPDRDAPNGKTQAPDVPIDLDRLDRVSRGKVALQKRLLAAFIDATQTDLDGFERALAEGDAELLGNMAHRLKGAAANVGATPMSERAARLEKLAAAKQFDDAQSLVVHLVRDWQQVREFAEALERS